jgi:hypothetical protein
MDGIGIAARGKLLGAGGTELCARAVLRIACGYLGLRHRAGSLILGLLELAHGRHDGRRDDRILEHQQRRRDRAHNRESMTHLGRGHVA